MLYCTVYLLLGKFIGVSVRAGHVWQHYWHYIVGRFVHACFIQLSFQSLKSFEMIFMLMYTVVLPHSEASLSVYIVASFSGKAIGLPCIPIDILTQSSVWGLFLSQYLWCEVTLLSLHFSSIFQLGNILYNRKLLREKTFMNFTVLWLYMKVSSAKFGVWHPLAWQKRAICKSFLCENCIFHQFAKVFFLESFPLYGIFLLRLTEGLGAH